MISKEEYYNLTKQIVGMVNAELDYYEKDEKYENKTYAYPRFVVMYSFLQLLRGEAFVNIRPFAPEYQRELRRWEDDFWQRVEEFRKNFDWSKNGEADWKLEEWRNLFENPEILKKKWSVSIFQRIFNKIKKLFKGGSYGI